MLTIVSLIYIVSNILNFELTRGSGLVYWSAQKIAIPRVEGSHPGLSISFVWTTYQLASLLVRNLRGTEAAIGHKAMEA